MQEIQRKHFGYWILRSVLAFAGLAGAIWALAGIWENDSDNDGWSDEEEILAGTNPFDETDPWDSDGDGIADYLEFLNGTDPLDAGDPPKTSLVQAGSGLAPLDGIRSVRNLVPTASFPPQPTITPAEPFPANAKKGETSATLRLEGGTATGSGFKGIYELSVPVGNYYKIELSADDIATIECDGLTVESKWIPAEKRIRSGEGVSTYRDIADLNGTRTFSIAYENKGGPYVLSVTYTWKTVDKAREYRKCIENRNQTAFFADSGHVGMISKGYQDPYFPQNSFGKIWVI